MVLSQTSLTKESSRSWHFFHRQWKKLTHSAGATLDFSVSDLTLLDLDGDQGRITSNLEHTVKKLRHKMPHSASTGCFTLTGRCHWKLLKWLVGQARLVTLRGKLNCQWSWKRFVQEEAWTRHDLERGLAPRAFQECCSQQSSFWIRSLQTCRTWAETTAVSSTMCTEYTESTLIEAVFLFCSFLTALGILMLLSFLFSSLALVWRSRYMMWTDILDSCTLGEEVLHPRTSSLCSLQLRIRLWQPIFDVRICSSMRSPMRRSVLWG